MELEVIRMCAAAAADNAIGVNAMIDTLTLDGQDTRPGHVHVYNSVDDGFVARRAVPEQGGNITFPALAVMVYDPITFSEVRTTVRDGRFPVAFAYLQRDSDSAKGNRSALYTNRAILRFLSRFLAPTAAAQALRLRNGVGIIGPTDLDQATKQPPIFENWKGGICTAVTVIDLLARDTAA